MLQVPQFNLPPLAAMAQKYQVERLRPQQALHQASCHAFASRPSCTIHKHTAGSALNQPHITSALHLLQEVKRTLRARLRAGGAFKSAGVRVLNRIPYLAQGP